MSIIHVRPWQSKRYGWKSKRSNGDTQGLRIERTRQGILYVRQPRGEKKFTIWYIDASGEALIRDWGVADGEYLTPKLLRHLRENGNLYSEHGATRPAPESTAKQSKGTQSQRGPHKNRGGSAPATLPSPAKGKPNQTIATRESVKQWFETQSERSRRWSSGKLHVVPQPSVRQPQAKKPKPIPSNPVQLSARAGRKRRKRQKLASGDAQQLATQAARKGVLESTAKSARTSSAGIHPGWLKSSGRPPAGTQPLPEKTESTNADANGTERLKDRIARDC